MTCYDCIHKISERDDTYCRKNNRVIADGQGFGDCIICDKFRQDKLTCTNCKHHTSLEVEYVRNGFDDSEIVAIGCSFHEFEILNEFETCEGYEE